VRGNVDSLMRVLAALDAAGIEVINEEAVSQSGGRGVRLKASPGVKPVLPKTSELSRPVPGAKVHP
jgi:hypothetical protein